ncbi:MAG: HD domain-containing protein [Candidatus Riflebacteria bacterium]|nr:HD domain-containing protein [Candidatus Riflebacteria bacterium]
MSNLIGRQALASLRSWFDRYVDSFMNGDPARDCAIRLKRDHTDRVCREIVGLARSLSLPDDRQVLAETAALFHDVGRFEQFARWGTYLDARSEDHAALGVEVLERHRPLDTLDPAARRLVTSAVRLHNRIEIPAHESDDCKLVTRLVRDADKLDIWDLALRYYCHEPGDWNEAIELELPDVPRISDEVFAGVMDRRMPRMRAVKTLGDFKIIQMGWVFDLNFDLSFELVARRGYLERLRGTLFRSDRVERVFGVVRTFVEERRPGGCRPD